MTVSQADEIALKGKENRTVSWCTHAQEKSGINYSSKTISIKSYGVIFWDKNTLCEFHNLTGLLTEVQCKSKRLRRSFNQKMVLHSDFPVEDEGADSKLVSSTTRSGRGVRLFFHTLSCFFIDSVYNRHTSQMPLFPYRFRKAWC